MIAERLAVRFDSNYLADWLFRRGHSLRKPVVAAVKRNNPAIATWIAEDWPRLKKNAMDERAHLVLIDERGLFINPTMRRTWAPKGHTPALTGLVRHHDKVSTIAAISVAPRRRRVGLYWQTDLGHFIDAAGVVAFLRDLMGRLRGRVIVVWDGGSNHKGPLIWELLSRYARLHLERLPAYATELNPVEFLRGHTTHGLTADFVPKDVMNLDRVVNDHLNELSWRPEMIRSLWDGSKLPFIDKNRTT